MEWVPHAAGGRVLTSQELLEFFDEFQGEQHISEARLYSVEEEGDASLASGSFRLKGGGGISDFQIHFVYEFEDERLVRASTYATQADALDAIARRRRRVTALLHERFPALRETVPHLRLGEPPSPVRRLRALATGPGPEVWLKDDGAYGAPHGGNKVRKLEWILPDVEARGRRTIVTVGGLAHEPRAGHGGLGARAGAAHGACAGRPAARRSRAQPGGAHPALGCARLPDPREVPHLSGGALDTPAPHGPPRPPAALLPDRRRVLAARLPGLRGGRAGTGASRSRAASCPSPRTSSWRSGRAARRRAWRRAFGSPACAPAWWAWS